MEHAGTEARPASFGDLICLVLFFRTLVVKPLYQWPQCTRNRAVVTTVEGRSSGWGSWPVRERIGDNKI